MKISRRALEQKPADESQYRIAEILVQRRHCVRLDTAAKAIAHDQIVAFAQFLNKWHQVDEVVRIVGVAHDDEPSARRANSTHEGAAVTLRSHIDHATSALRRQTRRAVSRSIVGDHDFAIDAVRFNEAASFVDADLERFGLVETRHDDREFALGEIGIIGATPGSARRWLYSRRGFRSESFN